MTTPILPTPTGQAPFTTQVTQGHTVPQIVAAMKAKGYNQMAAQFQAFADQHPGVPGDVLLHAFLGTELGKSLSAGIGGTGALLGGIPGAAAKGAENVYKLPVIGAITNITDFLSRLTSMNLWIRVGEFLLGSLLILAGALKLSGNPADVKDIAALATKVIK